MKKYSIVSLLLLLFAQSAFTKTTSGEGVYKFLSLPSSSHVAALGGTNVSLYNQDLNFALHNPALLNLNMHNRLALNASNYLADIAYGSASYSHKLNDNNYVALGVLFVDYGNFSERNEFDEELGEFSATDVALHLMYGRKLSDKWNIGLTLKPIFSSYEQYSSIGLGVDVGMVYHVDEKNFSAGFVLKNIGTQLKGYYNDGSQHIEEFPFSIEAGVSKKLANAPFRFTITAHDLQRWDMAFKSNLTTTELDGSIRKISNKPSFGENLLRHIIIGVELVPSDNFYISIGYNHQRSKELKVLDNKSLNGFSFGAGLKLKMFKLGFSMAKYHTANTSYNFSISTDLDSFKF